ncbi:hypothetical protein A2774_06070 [Candidatus Roizmanbacteria bacterium RIFCSPHIGHO2_01_FULL_39_12c]|uniref:DUF1189 domain-containing protein n=1 Tax=Candidatus Roizmanbacteria bacterium RIFCSPHIGHO2_01_FULL_39_12c TaxID=1802031 RepID=A0A1F7G9G8_9BACT|nr:MAG: hypothetical protein A2774_06070 [Candidatus Roizmanbacteria bacterium RIFCSPHIGHO2_01_FULL_39_12c]OGK47252.1 MAG: hypothetical protein A2963_04265 [Candidatus Roizmanbacteria bacterium RIFCSPLOWO2_01_FULL_40_13]
MNYLKVFWYVFRKSFSSAEYYHDVIKAPFSFSLKYFLFYALLMAAISTLFLSVRLFFPLSDFLQRFPTIITKVYPEDLEIRIRNGVVTTNAPEPYIISIDEFEEELEELEDVRGITSDEIKNILVIDTNAGIDDLESYQTFVLLTRNHISYYRDDGRIETVLLSDIKNFTLNERVIRGQYNKFLPFLRFLSLFLIPFLFTGSFLFFSVGQMFYLAVAALLLFLGSKLISYPISYLKAYQIDLHLATIIAPFFLLMSAMKIQAEFPFLKLIVFTVVGVYILNSLKIKAKNPAVVKKTSKQG